MIVLAYGGDSRLIVLDILRVHMSLIDRTKRYVPSILNMHVVDWQIILSTLSH